ncbi:MAG: AAA family ATPase [Candidatus Micrarchaeia archaeon]
MPEEKLAEGIRAAEGRAKPQPKPEPRPRSLREEKLKALLVSLQQNESLLAALLVAAGALFLLLAFAFYPLYLIPLLVLAVFAIAYRSPPFGTIAGVLLAFPAVMHQSPVFAWFFLLIITITLFEAFAYWYIISFLEIIVLAPFAPEPVRTVGGLIIPLLTLAALMLGSRRSTLMALPCVFLILLLSALWQTPNGAFMPLKGPAGVYASAPYLQLGAAEVGLLELIPTAMADFATMFSGETVRNMNEGIGLIIGATLQLLFADSGLIQILAWTLIVYAVGFVPGAIRHRYEQGIASAVFVLIIPVYYLATLISETAFNPLIFLFVGMNTALLFLLDHLGIYIAGEERVRTEERMAKFGKFGIQDLSLSTGVSGLADIGGYEDVKKELYEAIVWPLRQKELTMAYGIRPPTGVLLFGPPGTGKTLLMRALAKELGFGVYYVKCSDLLSQWYGESERNLTELFKIARAQAPCILFFDEIDSIGKKRELFSADDVAPRLLSLFLAEMDGFKTVKNVIIVGTTNVPHLLDPALLRPGRFDKIIYIPLPDRAAREQIFRIHTKNMPLAPDVDFARLAEITERYSGADIANICAEAARKAAEEAVAAKAVVPVAMRHFAQVLERIKPSVSLEALENFESFKLDFERRAGRAPEEKKEEIVTWKDVVGLDDVRRALIEAIEIPLMHEDLMKEYKIKPSKGLLLFGPPGCGKTLIVKAASNELKATFLTISGALLLKRGYEGAVGVIRETFNRARERAPAIIFIDEIEAVAPSRELYTSKVVEDIVTQMLTELDGVKELKNVVLIGATNKPKMLDPALLRPGRFDKILFVPPPDREGRKALFAHNLEGIPLADDVDFDELAKRTEGFTGADIASICQEAKMTLVRARIRGEQEVKLSQSTLLDILKTRKPSITVEMLKEYLAFLKEYGERR